MDPRFGSVGGQIMSVAFRIPFVALCALLLACGPESPHPDRPAPVPAPPPAVAPRREPPVGGESAPEPKANPRKTPKDSSDLQNYPWQSGPIASL